MTIEPILFSARPDLISELASDAGGSVAALVVDWERRGKRERQRHAVEFIGTDTQISVDTYEDLSAAVALSNSPTWCRINSVGVHTPLEVEEVIARGASEILVPMVRHASEVERVLDLADGRISVGILLETTDAVHNIGDLRALPLTRAYVGLMDLGIDRGSGSIFDPFVDGTLAHIRAELSLPLGVGGLTTPNGGSPLPSPVLASEISRLGYDFSFLRRSFIRDAADDPRRGLQEVRAMLDRVEGRTASEVDADHQRFTTAIEAAFA